MGLTDSKRERKRRSYCRRGERWRRPSRMKTMLGSAIAAMCRSSRASASNGSCAIQKRKKRSPSCAITSSVSFPVHWEKVYAQWLENIRDWCISRQVWWGHRIPAWYPKQKSEIRNPKSEIYVGIEPPTDPENWVHDADTLDTWFSSWLWAYETMDDETRRKFYPTSVLVTAPDIIFFWVARMIIAGLEFKPGKSDRDEDNIPFRHVYFTGLDS